MDWKKVVNSRWLGFFGFVSLVWGIPGMREDATGWREWFGVMNSGWFYAAAGVGAAVVGIWMIVVVSHYRAVIRTYWKELATFAAMVLMICFAIGMFYYLFFVYERPKWIWTHPTLSPAEQAKAKAECEMAAYDAIGGGGGIASPKSSDRYAYKSACLTSEGFRRERIDGE